MNAITPQTTVIMLGDARSNNLDPRADILRRIGERSKRLVWLNPEGRMAWGLGDSEMPRYATFCTVVRQCATAQQLERAVSDIVATLSIVPDRMRAPESCTVIRAPDSCLLTPF